VGAFLGPWLEVCDPRLTLTPAAQPTPAIATTIPSIGFSSGNRLFVSDTASNVVTTTVERFAVGDKITLRRLGVPAGVEMDVTDVISDGTYQVSRSNLVTGSNYLMQSTKLFNVEAVDLRKMIFRLWQTRPAG
jgi:hypothetical protein